MNSSEKMEPKYPFSEIDLRGVKVSQLKEMCKMNGFKCSGNKSLLIDYLTGRVDGHKKARKKARSAVMARDGTLKYEAAKDCVDSWSKQQPEFTKEDQAMKQKIWGYENGHCAFSGVPCKGVGDHMIGMREGFKVGFHHFGVNDQWGKIPCAPYYNSGNKCWKKVVINGEMRWLTYEDFTPEELAEIKETSPNKFQYYNCWLEWCAYVASRGAKLYYPDMRPRDEMHACIVETHLMRMDVELKKIYSLSNEQISNELPTRKANLEALKAAYAQQALPPPPP